MGRRRLSQFEEQLAHLVEGGFARLFAGRLHPREVAVRLARAMDENVRLGLDGLIVAPNVYIVHLHPDDHAALLAAHPDLPETLAENVIALAAAADMRLLERPGVTFESDAEMPQYAARVEACHLVGVNLPTHSMTPLPAPPLTPKKIRWDAWLVIQGRPHVALERPAINIGRRKDNHIVIDDPRVSREHAQLRLRFDHYVIYDLDSKAGTYINDQRITEGILRPGDVISLAGVMLVYMEDESADEQGQPIGSSTDTQIRPPGAPDGIEQADPTL
jgi:hypothetical protein